MSKFPVAALLLVLAGGASTQAGELEDLADFVKRYEDTWQSHDARRLAEYFTEDADMLVGIQPRIDGRAAIEAWWAQYFSRIDKNRRLSIEIMSIRLLNPEVALINVTTTTGGTGGGMEERKARGTWIVVRSGGNDWQIAALRAHSPVGQLRENPGTDN